MTVEMTEHVNAEGAVAVAEALLGVAVLDGVAVEVEAERRKS